jgi:hypothetical protein
MISVLSPRPTVIVHNGHVITLAWGWWKSQFFLDAGSYYEAQTLASGGTPVMYRIFRPSQWAWKHLIIKVYPNTAPFFDEDPGELVYSQ